ncbi:MAG: hypothetical protein ACYDB4_19340, partial [Candidatus Dormibacteraceae bacterium]
MTPHVLAGSDYSDTLLRAGKTIRGFPHSFPVVGAFLRNGKLLTLMLGHLTVDTYAGVIPVLYPVLIGRFNLSLATVGLVS